MNFHSCAEINFDEMMLVNPLVIDESNATWHVFAESVVTYIIFTESDVMYTFSKKKKILWRKFWSCMQCSGLKVSDTYIKNRNHYQFNHLISFFYHLCSYKVKVSNRHFNRIDTNQPNLNRSKPNQNLHLNHSVMFLHNTNGLVRFYR